MLSRTCMWVVLGHGCFSRAQYRLVLVASNSVPPPLGPGSVPTILSSAAGRFCVLGRLISWSHFFCGENGPGGGRWARRLQMSGVPSPHPPPPRLAVRLAFVCSCNKVSAAVIWLGGGRELMLAGDMQIQVLCWVTEGSLWGDNMLVP